MELEDRKFYVVDVDQNNLVMHGPFDTEEEADETASSNYGPDFWTNASPYAVWSGYSLKQYAAGN